LIELAVLQTPTNFVGLLKIAYPPQLSIFMKKQIVACAFFLSTFVNLSLGQQTTAMEQRALSASQLFLKHQGQYEAFKSLVIRFEVAWQEADAQSMAELKAVLGKMVAEYNGLSYPTSENESMLLERAAKKAMVYQELNKLPISAADTALGPKIERVLEQFRQYQRFLEADILAHQKALEH
jgi:hypothetical protein